MQTERIQVALRLPTELYERVKKKAKSEKRSVNSFVETVLEKHAQQNIDQITPEDLIVSDEVRSLQCSGFKRPSQEQIDADPKLAYLVKKYGL